jgi:hypothetical protein
LPDLKDGQCATGRVSENHMRQNIILTLIKFRYFIVLGKLTKIVSEKLFKEFTERTFFKFDRAK